MLEFAINTAEKAGRYLAEHFGKDLQVEHKGRIDLVTQVDRAAQDLIVSMIEERYPGHSLVAEEGVTRIQSSPYVWYIDPLDGTVNYVHGIPIFCVSIAVYKDGEPLIGVCYNPISKELFWAHAGNGAYLNGKKIRVSAAETLVDALVVTGFPYATDRMDRIIGRFSTIIREVQGIRRLGSAALDLCFVACGRFDGFWEEGLRPWDMAAGIVILSEAGGTCSSFCGAGIDLAAGEIVAGNMRIHHELVRLV